MRPWLLPAMVKVETNEGDKRAQISRLSQRKIQDSCGQALALTFLPGKLCRRDSVEFK
jgi:hypothetical protein